MAIGPDPNAVHNAKIDVLSWWDGGSSEECDGP